MNSANGNFVAAGASRGPVRAYFRDIWKTVHTILVGMRISLKYCFAKTITLQYPDVAPALQPRYRGFHFFEIEKCIACDMCAKACPVDCIYIEKTGPRKVDKNTGIATGGLMTRYAIDYAKCMFCALCVDPCPTECIHMGNLHDMSGYTRDDMIVEFTDLAKEGLQTPQPLWMQSEKPPAWAQQRKAEWEQYKHSRDQLTSDVNRRREEMAKAVAPEA
ncbi:MAG: NADH-quinone oxidoreductase subunit I [Planctomycetes bacterium]|nr:NADH-quinone oxidoreductase subunit I [Planctomycetota bacterium]MBI3834882.1 NADH-quinone oxidoreductase subunit I [Planctomycetota bacterium]